MPESVVFKNTVGVSSMNWGQSTHAEKVPAKSLPSKRQPRTGHSASLTFPAMMADSDPGGCRLTINGQLPHLFDSLLRRGRHSDTGTPKSITTSPASAGIHPASTLLQNVRSIPREHGPPVAMAVGGPVSLVCWR